MYDMLGVPNFDLKFGEQSHQALALTLAHSRVQGPHDRSWVCLPVLPELRAGCLPPRRTDPHPAHEQNHRHPPWQRCRVLTLPMHAPPIQGKMDFVRCRGEMSDTSDKQGQGLFFWTSPTWHPHPRAVPIYYTCLCPIVMGSKWLYGGLCGQEPLCQRVLGPHLRPGRLHLLAAPGMPNPHSHTHPDPR